MVIKHRQKFTIIHHHQSINHSSFIISFVRVALSVGAVIPIKLLLTSGFMLNPFIPYHGLLEINFISFKSHFIVLILYLTETIIL